MEEVKKKKGNKGFVVFLIVLILLLLGCLGFGAYKYAELNNDYNELSIDRKKVEDELNKQKEDNKKITEASQTNDYSVFVNKMKEERTKLFNTKDTDNDFSDHLRTYAKNEDYMIYLTKDGNLQLYIDNKKTDIDKNVILFRVVFTGNGAYKTLFYVKEDGNVYSANVEEVVNDHKKMIIKKQTKPSKIVSIMPGSSTDVVKDNNGNVVQGGGGAAHPFFIDINGNIYSYEYTE